VLARIVGNKDYIYSDEKYSDLERNRKFNYTLILELWVGDFIYLWFWNNIINFRLNVIVFLKN